jgi:hypothetical protein
LDGADKNGNDALCSYRIFFRQECAQPLNVSYSRPGTISFTACAA